MSEWMPIDTAPRDVVVDTKIDDASGARNEQPLKCRGRLWWVPDDSMYVYYVPTHWKPRYEGDTRSADMFGET